VKWLLVLMLFTGCTIEVRPIKKQQNHRHHYTSKHPQPKPSPTPDLSRLAPILRDHE